MTDAINGKNLLYVSIAGVVLAYAIVFWRRVKTISVQQTQRDGTEKTVERQVESSVIQTNYVVGALVLSGAVYGISKIVGGPSSIVSMSFYVMASILASIVWIVVSMAIYYALIFLFMFWVFVLASRR